MHMAIVVYECGRGGRCVHKLTTHIHELDKCKWRREMKIGIWANLCVPVGEKEVSLQEIRSGFKFVPGLFDIILRGGYLYGAWSRTVLILIEFKFIIP